ncbi:MULTISPECIES: sigma-54-dependent Fis family transcriptional regulator [unclassified Thioalkalivibrio]|uniref:sigma-54 interaction domain-containing protein n=2 Tax=unclassified Thioalkalivibrio TaxID=2621013 RepID=UPI001E46F4A7|nr:MULTISPECIES: sigma-54 dependent transcriptional regulator [unclassified Thioalkalivibrio]
MNSALISPDDTPRLHATVTLESDMQANGHVVGGLVSVVPLVESRSPEQLRRRTARLLEETVPTGWVRLLALDASGRWMSADANAARYACDDFRHPYAHVVRSGRTLQARVADLRGRMDDPEFRADIEDLPGDWEIECRPLRGEAAGNDWLGVMALAGPTGRLRALRAAPDLGALERLVSTTWYRLLNQARAHRRDEDLRHSLNRLQQDSRARSLEQALGRRLIGGSPAMAELRSRVIRAAETRLAVLLQGETGTGKEHVARAIHEFSARREKAFVAINCAAIPEALLESELFGHLRGAHSGATHDRAGLLAEADGGTLFLDEIGDMPSALQAKLLRVLESGRYRPLGGGREHEVDVRLVSATHQPLVELIRDRRFRADLYYRLNQFPLHLPPLRERREDIDELARHFVDEFAAREGRDGISISHEALACLEGYEFPGNLRELRNTLEYACAMASEGEVIRPELLPVARATEPVVPGASNPAQAPVNLRQAVRDYEARLIREKLRQFEGDRAKAALSLGVPKRTLAYKCRQFELDKDFT